LDLVFQRFNAPVYFVTFNTHTGLKVQESFVAHCCRAADFHIGVVRYVLMPDHVHLFACFGVGLVMILNTWIKRLKRELDRVPPSMGREPLKRLG